MDSTLRKKTKKISLRKKGDSWESVKVFLYHQGVFLNGNGFSALLMLGSVTLILCVGAFIVLKVSVGVDLPFVALNHLGQLEKFGQIGDFFGGVLNPLFSFMALLGVLYTIRTQGKELREAREETRIANRIQDKQTAVFERQNFESVFFRLIDVHARTAERIRSDGDSKSGLNGFEVIVRAVLEAYGDNQFHAELNKRTPKPQYEVEGEAEEQDRGYMEQAVKYGIQSSDKVQLSQYYRNIYQILKLIDGFKLSSGDEHIGGKTRRQLRLEYFQRRQYCNFLRAQLSDDELKLLFFNCITDSGAGLKLYVERYSLLKHLHMSEFVGGKKHLVDMYDAVAYADYEDISDDQIQQFANVHSRAQYRAVFPSR